MELKFTGSSTWNTGLIRPENCHLSLEKIQTIAKQYIHRGVKEDFSRYIDKGNEIEKSQFKRDKDLSIRFLIFVILVLIGRL